MFCAALRWLPPWSTAVLLAVSLTLSGCAKEHHDSEISCKTSKIPCLKGPAFVSIDTTKGTVVLKLDGSNAPMTAGNFVDLVNRGVYNGTVFHRVVRSPLPFVVQGGDPNSADPKTPVSTYGTGNFIDPSTGEARFIPLELKLKTTKQIQYGEEIGTSGLAGQPILSHVRGAVAMARSTDPNSASSQFYIALEALPELDGHYAVFGKVAQGMDVVDRLQQGDKLIRARLIKP
jgi:peptidyl-prolyl cis-trans isomerase B (cyclophilin B)